MAQEWTTRGSLRAAGWVLAGALAALSPRASALINPNFTPLHLVEQSEQILVLEIGPAGAEGAIPVRLLGRLKGKGPVKAPSLDLSKTAKPQADALRKTLGTTQKRLALLFSGRYREEPQDGGQGGEPDEGALGLLHVEGSWFRLVHKGRGDAWLLDVVDDHLQGAWAGSTDMLRLAVKYVLTDPDPMVPVRTGATWGDKAKVTRLDGTVRGVIAVDLGGGGRLPPCLHVLCDTGDRILRWDAKGKALVDFTAKLGLRAKSRLAAWGDLDADGRLDLASWDGERMRLWFRAASGRFAAATGAAQVLKGPCIGLSVLDVSVKGRPGILASTPSVPTLLTPQAGRSFVAKPLTGESPSAGLGQARPCLVADLDGDHIADVLQPFAKGALLSKGKKPGAFARPRRCGNIGTGKGAAGAFLGDYDADGLLDVFVAAEERCGLWHNRGGGKFEDAFGFAGELPYISKTNAIGGTTGDINNDGRQDILILYSDRSPQLFFNRGYRSFGHSHMLDLAEKRLLPAAAKGQQAGLLADLNGDGGQDMALVLKNGELWVFFRDVNDAPGLCLRAALPLTGPFTGPVSVTGWSEHRCLGAWNVVRGSSEAFLGMFDAGPCRVKWQFPGRRAQEKEVIVEDGPMRFSLRPPGGQ